ncbi:MAG: DUF6178 family protein [Candidatus Uhrbacteria bacterium]
MQTRALTVANPKEQAEAKSRLLRAAISLIIERVPNHDLTHILQAFLEYVAKRDNFDLTRPNQMTRAEAIIIVTLNLGLEVHANNNVNKAAKALYKKPVLVFQLGEKTVADLKTRIAKVVKQAVVPVKVHKRYKYYGVTDAETEQQLANWNSGQLSEHSILPLANLSEIQLIEQVLDRVEQEVCLSRKVNWYEILGRSRGICHFAAKYFLRSRRETINPAGGIWRPFVTSLVAKVLTSTWGNSNIQLGNLAQLNLERYLVITEEALREILDLVMFEPEKISQQAIPAAVKITTAAMDSTIHWHEHGVFSDKCNQDEVREILGLASQALERFATDARTFYLAVTSVDQPSRAELDRFWRSRLLLHNETATRPLQARLDEEVALHHQPWQKLPKTRNLAEVVSCIAGFTVWPIAEQVRFATEYDFERTIAREGQLDQVVNQLNKIFQLVSELDSDHNNYVQMIIERINWSSRVNLVVELCKRSKADQRSAEMDWISSHTKWNKQALFELSRENIYGIGLGPAIVAMREQLNETDWREIMPVGMGPSNELIKVFFMALNEEQRARFIVMLDTTRFSSILNRFSIKELEEVFAPIVRRLKSDPGYKKEFNHWYDGNTNSYSQQIRLRDPEKDYALLNLLTD